MPIKIVTDSSCDLMSALAHSKGVSVVPVHIGIGSHTYRDGLDLTPPELLAKLADPRLGGTITTAHPTPQDFLEAYQALPAECQILSIHPSSSLSGSYNAALQARKLLPQGEERVWVVDSGSVSIGLALFVLEACEMIVASPHLKVAEILPRLEELRPRLRLLFTASNLRSLARGGRVSQAASRISSMLSVNYVFKYDGQKSIVAIAQTFDLDSALDIIVQRLQADDLLTPIKRLYIGYTHNFHTSCRPSEAEEPSDLSSVFAQIYQKISALNLHAEICHTELGCAVTAHCGEDVLGVAYVG